MEKTDIVDLITCPVCFELSKPPIWQCSNGHVVCESCTISITKQAKKAAEYPLCPVCRVLCKNWSRNLSLEKMAKATLTGHTYPCPNECGLMLSYGNEKGHVSQCRAAGIPCLSRTCDKKVPRLLLANHVLTSHRDVIEPIYIGVGTTRSLGTLKPTVYVPFAPKEDLTRCYILAVYQDEVRVAAWLLIKRHRKTHIEVGIECLHVHEGYERLSYTISAMDTARTSLALTIRSINLRLRDETQKGVVLKDIPAHDMSVFRVGEESQGTLQIAVNDEKRDDDNPDAPPLKRARPNEKE